MRHNAVGLFYKCCGRPELQWSMRLASTVLCSGQCGMPGPFVSQGVRQRKAAYVTFYYHSFAPQELALSLPVAQSGHKGLPG
jgi:hypothetical protein